MGKTGEWLYGCLRGSYTEGRQRRLLSWGCLKTGIQILNKETVVLKGLARSEGSGGTGGYLQYVYLLGLWNSMNLGREEEEFLDQRRVSAKQKEKPLSLTITGNKPM